MTVIMLYPGYRLHNDIWMKKIQACIPIFNIYCLWIIISYGVYWLVCEMPVSAIAYMVLSLLVTLFFILLGFALTAYYLIYGRRRLDAYPGIRLGWLLFSLMLAVLIYSLGQRLQIWRPVLFSINTANLFVFANLVGAFIVKPLKRMPELIILCVVVAFADLSSVLSGPTRSIVESIKTYYGGGMKGPAPPGDFLLIKLPAPGAVHLQPVFGVSDWIIIVFLSAAAFKFAINDNLAGRGLPEMDQTNRVSFYFPVAGFGLLLAMTAARLFELFIPVLPLIALVYIAYILIFYPSSRRLRKTDWWLMGGFVAVMSCLLGLGIILTQ